MKIIILIASAFLALKAKGQTPINKSYPASGISSVDLHFDYPELIKISSWDKNEILVSGTIEINGGENDDAFKMENSTSGNTLFIKGTVPNAKDLPHRITAYKNGKEGGKLTFKSKADFEKYKKETGESFNITNWGNDMDIVLEIKIPAHLQVNIKSVYGMVELKNISQTKPLVAKSTYGGVDAAINTNSVGELWASSDFGEIYSNLGLKFTGEGLKQGDFHKEISSKPGNGPKFSFESKYGNVYMRKAN
ncbi:MAG: hypothetical protein KA143_02690 [Saprospiraceae bacterium]|nr:hypothetical protein [Saprospiraceae bacterium]